MSITEKRVLQYRTKVANVRVSLRWSGLICALDDTSMEMNACMASPTNSIMVVISKVVPSSMLSLANRWWSKPADRTLVGYSAWNVIFLTWVWNRTKLVVEGDGLKDLVRRVLVWLKLVELVFSAGFNPGVENRRSLELLFNSMPWERAHRSWNSISFSHSEQYNGPSNQVISESFCLKDKVYQINQYRFVRRIWQTKSGGWPVRFATISYQFKSDGFTLLLFLPRRSVDSMDICRHKAFWYLIKRVCSVFSRRYWSRLDVKGSWFKFCWVRISCRWFWV